jgi:hypothetical protein
MFGQLTFFSYFCAQIAREAARTWPIASELAWLSLNRSLRRQIGKLTKREKDDFI